MATLKDDLPSIRKVWILIATLAMAVLMSFLFIKLIIVLDMKDYLGLVVPLLPVFYTIIYPMLDRPFSSDTHKKVAQGEIAPVEFAMPSYFRNLSLWRICGAVTIATLIKFLMEFSHYAMLIFLSDGSITNVWMQLDPLLIIRLVKGDLASSPIALLFIELAIMSLAAGIWLGYTSRTRPVMEGIIAGTILSGMVALTNLTPLYGKFSDMTSQIAGKAGEGLHLGLFSGILFFTFIFNCWVLLGMQWKSVHLRGKKGAKKK